MHKQNLCFLFAVKPVVQLRSEKQASGGHPAMLMCSAYDFYPPVIDVYWLRDSKRAVEMYASRVLHGLLRYSS